MIYYFMAKYYSTWLCVEPDPEDGLTEEVHHVEDRGREFEEVLTLAVEEEPAKGAMVFTNLF